MSKRKRGELEQQVSSNIVHYTMNKGRVVFRAKGEKDRVVQLRDGSYDRVKFESVELVRQGSRREGRLSQGFDVSRERDAEQVAFIDNMLEEYPEIANANGIEKVDVNFVDAPGGLIKWRDMPAAQIKAVLDGTGIPLEQAMRFELQGDEPRTDVIKVIESLYAKREAEAIEESEEAPTI